MVYILGYRPYEFGLVPDPRGFVTYKELLRVIHEEPGWTYVRQANINEVLLGKNRNLFQTEERRISAIERRWAFDFELPPLSLPKILYIGIRRKAHPVVMEKGLRPIMGDKYHVLSPEREMAHRIGKRLDQQPLLLEVMSDMARKKGVLFHPFGDLFLATEIPAIYIAGPPVPKHVIKAREDKSQKTSKPGPDFQAGTFILDINRGMDKSRVTGGRKKKGWKEEVRRQRRKGN
jgi:putative RNA 2'-phosphotransferase